MTHLYQILLVIVMPLPVIGVFWISEWIGRKTEEGRGRLRMGNMVLFGVVVAAILSLVMPMGLVMLAAEERHALRIPGTIGFVISGVLLQVVILRAFILHLRYHYRRAEIEIEPSILHRAIARWIGLIWATVFATLLIAGGLGFVPSLRDVVLLRLTTAIVLCAFAMAVSAPLWLGWFWGTSAAVDGDLRQGIDRLCRQAGVRGLRVRVLEAPEAITGAWIAGLFPGMRTMFLSRGLLRRLRTDEVLAVVAHELGHARLHHLIIYAGLTVAGIAVSYGIAGLLAPDGLEWAGAVLGAVLFVCVAPFAAHAVIRRCEAQADRYAVMLLGEGARLASALEAIVTKPQGERRRGRLARLLDTHPFIEDRLRRLRELESVTAESDRVES